MSFSVKNRIPQLQASLTRLNNPAYRESKVHPLAERFSQRMLTTLRNNAPMGKVEPEFPVGDPASISTGLGRRIISHGRPSLRLHGTTLADSWLQPEVRNELGSTTIAIRSQAPHMPILLAGAIGHTIPVRDDKIVSFYWYKRSQGMILKEVHHPGFRPMVDWRTKSILQNRAEGTRIVQYGQRASLTVLRNYFSG